jgi:hypothetical protein
MRKLPKFLLDEKAAVTVDWVMLTAAIVALSLFTFVPLYTSTDGVANTIATSITTAVNQ